jgi:hypothetical protein
MLRWEAIAPGYGMNEVRIAYIAFASAVLTSCLASSNPLMKDPKAVANGQLHSLSQTAFA